ncbi:MAG: hypothetical protein JWM27_4242 [Gemmatimonadetes bacterium]|nr:hypothetical protein [Gemmatimonadota bacterium]
MWWRITTRSWRQDTLLLPVLAAFAAMDGVQTLRTDGAPSRAVVLSALFGAALLTAALLPIQLRTASLLAPTRIRLLPLRPATLAMAGPMLGNPFRLVLCLVALGWALAGVGTLGLGASTALLTGVQLAAWTAAALLAGEVLEARLRASSSALLYLPATLALWAAASAFFGFGRLRPTLAGLDAARVGGWRVLLINGGSPADAGVAAGLAVAVMLAMGALAAWTATHPPQASPRAPRARLLTGAVARVARVLAPRAPAAFARELAATLRIPLFWANHAFLLLCGAAAASSGNAPLVIAGFLLWIGAAYNLLGTDVPMGGMTRHALLPGSIHRALRMRHAAVLAGAVAIVGAAFVLAAVLRSSPPAGGWRPGALLLWTAYGASVFLLFTVAGDRFSLRQPRALYPGRLVGEMGGAGSAGAGMLLLASYIACMAAAAAVLLAWRLVLSAASPHADAWPSVLLASLTHLLLYAAANLRRARGSAR